MKLSILSLLPVAMALPHAPAKRDVNTFTVMALRSASPIHFLPMTASGNAFWLGGKTASFCPDNVPNCPPGNVTAFAGDTEYSMDAMVPGGQQVYVDSAGAVRFTIPHSGYIPPGSSTGPFEYTAPVPNGNGLGSWAFKGQGASGFMACPTDDNRYQVFAARADAQVPGNDTSKCLGFNAATSVFEGTAAWEYT